jgi:hypothetical protein
MGGTTMKRVLLLVAAVALMGSSARKDAYIISAGDNITYNADSSVDNLQSIRKRMSGRYIWVRRGGQEYVIRDEATIGRVETLFAPMAALAPEQAEVGRGEARLDRATDRLEDKGHLAPEEKQRLRELREQQHTVRQRERELDEREEALERVAERAFWNEIDSAIRAGTAKPIAATQR